MIGLKSLFEVEDFRSEDFRPSNDARAFMQRLASAPCDIRTRFAKLTPLASR